MRPSITLMPLTNPTSRSTTQLWVQALQLPGLKKCPPAVDGPNTVSSTRRGYPFLKPRQLDWNRSYRRRRRLARRVARHRRAPGPFRAKWRHPGRCIASQTRRARVMAWCIAGKS
jgi:hypothetical protein